MNNKEKQLEYYYFPGCALEGTQKAYRVSTEAVAEKLGIKLKELDSWNCCGTPSIIGIQEIKALSLSARNLALVAKQGGKSIVSPCNTCFGTLKKANIYMENNEEIKNAINGALESIDLRYEPNSVDVRHFVDVMINDYGIEQIKEKIQKPLINVRAVPFYGCHFSRPFGEHDDTENPQKMDDLIKITGAEWVDYPMKNTCCGATLPVTDKDVGYRLLHEILRTAKEVKADLIITACPLCQTNLEMFQRLAKKNYDGEYDIPVMYITQLVGYALGISEKKLKLNKALRSPNKALAKARG